MWSVLTDGALRLVGSLYINHGRLEVYHSGQCVMMVSAPLMLELLADSLVFQDTVDMEVLQALGRDPLYTVNFKLAVYPIKMQNLKTAV